MENRKLLTMQNLKEIYGISKGTILSWEKQKLINPIKTPGGHRRYLKDDIEKLLSLTQEKAIYDIEKDTILYARVSTKKQEKYLENQINRLKEYANSKNYNKEVIYEIASGINENRKGLRELLNAVKNGKVRRIIIEYPDRLARFRFEYLKFFIETFGVELIVINGKENIEDMNQELAEDLIAIVTSFSARIYGKRGGKRKGVTIHDNLAV
ncbi:IS607 family transposase [Caldisericum exile]|uniref:Transposase for insertion sequence element n=1 Tax=Caldisericum exile (strain DSM 21853 / NBRC 104410 / AZM16c01) TaxID=511051 RepID=A0A7U6JFN2_CALEA|nr:IS607 family transposase [Caldisericum exile]BAL81708.1 putative transposase for insertion sequence element [Caldisericum exile AZM16c01]